MKKLMISITALMVSLVLNAQLYTPGQTIQGNSGNNYVGIGGTMSPHENLQVYSNVDGQNVSIGITGRSSYMGQTKYSGYRWLNTSSYLNSTLYLQHSSTTSFSSPSWTTVAEFTWGGMYEKVYYDLDNASYYLDPSATGTSLKAAGTITATQFTDVNNTSYYLDPSNTGISLNVAGKIQSKEIQVVDLSTGILNSDKIKTKNLNVEVNNVADYVFDKSYNLKSLAEVEKYIMTNKHLPGVPSAKEMESSGMNVAEMNNVLLKKVEELTLYVIDLQKQIDELKNQ